MPAEDGRGIGDRESRYANPIPSVSPSHETGQCGMRLHLRRMKREDAALQIGSETRGGSVRQGEAFAGRGGKRLEFPHVRILWSADASGASMVDSRRYDEWLAPTPSHRPMAEAVRQRAPTGDGPPSEMWITKLIAIGAVVAFLLYSKVLRKLPWPPFDRST